MKISRYLDFDMFGYTNRIVQEDLESIYKQSLPWNELNDKVVLITGANGMIATYLAYLLMYLNIKCNMNIQVIALSRNRNISLKLFSQFIKDSRFLLLSQDICEPIKDINNLDYIFHFAGNASPFYIKNDPVGIMKSNLLGTFNVLELSKKLQVRKILFASTREVYGENKNLSILSEGAFGYLNPLDMRSCYPESKRAAESLLESYYIQFGVDFNVIRIAHSYGPGMKLDNDGRVMPDLLSYVIKNQNIVLRSKGEALRSFCYLTDTVAGLFYVLFYGENAKPYNLANETNEISVKDLALMIIEKSSHRNLKIEYSMPLNLSGVYCNYDRVKLDTHALENLGWSPQISIQEGVSRFLSSLKG